MLILEKVVDEKGKFDKKEEIKKKKKKNLNLTIKHNTNEIK